MPSIQNIFVDYPQGGGGGATSGIISAINSPRAHACICCDVQMNTATERLRMFENAAMHTDMLLTAKQAEMMAVLVERDQVTNQTTA